MAYASWSVVFGEQPTAAKWNILGTNDAHFNTLLGTYGVRNPYCFRAYDSVGTTLTDNTFVTIALGTEVYDYNTNFAANTYTAPVAGVYHFDGCVTHATVSSTPVLALSAIYVDGTIAANGSASIASAATNTSAFQVSADLLLAANAAVTLRHFQNSAGDEASQTGASSTYFNGHLVHAT